jgi:hypothetical protein
MSSSGVETTVLAFYAVVVCGLISSTICRRAQDVLHKNVVARHATAISLLFFISALVEMRNPEMTVFKLTLYTTGAYIWFLMAAQGPFLIFAASMKIMLVAFLCRTYARWLEERGATTQTNDDIEEGGAIAELRIFGLNKDPVAFRSASHYIGSAAVATGFLSFGVFLTEQWVQHKENVVNKLIDYALGRAKFVIAKPLLPFLV